MRKATELNPKGNYCIINYSHTIRLLSMEHLLHNRIADSITDTVWVEYFPNNNNINFEYHSSSLKELCELHDSTGDHFTDELIKDILFLIYDIDIDQIQEKGSV